MADLPDVVAVFVIAGMVFLGHVNAYLQIRLHFRVVEVRIANVLLIRHVGGGDIGGLETGEHSGTGGHASGEEQHHHGQHCHNQQTLDNLWEKIAGCAAAAVENFKEAGVTALDKAVSAIGAKNVLESLQEQISGMIADTKQNIEKVESVGHELRSVGGHLKNAGRTLTGKETQVVDGGQEGRFQSMVLAPMRATKSLLSNMNNATLAAIGRVESLELSAEAAREARAERQAEKKPSIRQALAEKKAEIAGQPAPAPDKEHKPQEAAL